MAFSQEPLPEQKSAWSIARHGPDTPFRHHSVVQQYIKDLFIRKGYDSLVEFNTTVEHVQKVPNTSQWRLTLRKSGVGGLQDYWWTEDFDALVVASGHYSVPYIPHIEGLAEFAEQHLGAVEHSKSFRDFNKYKDKVRHSLFCLFLRYSALGTVLGFFLRPLSPCSSAMSIVDNHLSITHVVCSA